MVTQRRSDCGMVVLAIDAKGLHVQEVAGTARFLPRTSLACIGGCKELGGALQDLRRSVRLKPRGRQICRSLSIALQWLLRCRQDSALQRVV